MKAVNQNDLHVYGDYRLFIKDFYESKKANGSFSLATLARKVGISRVAVKYIIDRQRHISEEHIDAFCEALNLGGAQANYFASLVKFNKAKTTGQRNEHFKSMLRIRGSPLQDRLIDSSSIGYFQEWYYPAIAELSFVEGFRKNPAWIATRLYFKVSPEKIAKALSYLEANGYLKGSSAVQGRVKTADEISSHIGTQFLLRQTELARDAIETQSKQDREVFALTISVDAKKFALAKQMIVTFRHQLHDMLASTDDTAERVIQINMQMFTVAMKES